MRSVNSVSKIADPMRRLTAAAKLVRDADAAADEARHVRDMATVIAHLDNGVAPVVLYRDTLDVSRGLFNKVVGRAPAPEVRAAALAEHADLYTDPVATARKYARQVRRYERVAEQAREIRDTAALNLMSGREGEPVSNADISRASGLTTARVAQLRTGTR